LLGFLFAAAVVRLWLMILPSSFWVDEMATAFVVRRPSDPSFAVAPQVPASIYYWLPRLADRWFGLSEVAYRLPSVLLMLAAIWVVARLTARLIHPQASWFAAFACLALSGIDYFAVDARPYSMGMAVSAAAVWFLVRWLDRARWPDGLAFAGMAVLLWRVHLVYGPFYLVFAVYAAARWLRRETPVPWWQAAALFGIIGVALAPVAVQAAALARNAQAHVIVPPPGWRDFLHLARPNLVLICAAAAWTARTVLKARAERKAVGRAGVLLILAWWLAQPACLFLFSLATGDSLFVSRYLSLALPGAALAAVLATSLWLPASQWRTGAAVLGAAALLLFGQWSVVWPAHEKSGWRAAAAAVNRIEIASGGPVICPSPFVEARWPAWHPGYALPGFLYAHLAVYPVLGTVLPFPFAASLQGEAYAVEELHARLAPAGRFLIYGPQGGADRWRDWFAARPELRFWQARTRAFGDVHLISFEKPTA
jgi:hypothetical protein